MNASKLSPQALAVLVCGGLLFILSFFNWQEVSLFGYSGGINEWHGIGFFAALLVVAMLAWEGMRLGGVNLSVGTVSPALISLGLALLAVLFTLIAFLDKSEFRNWPAWIALIVALGLGVVAVLRAIGEGVQMPQSRPAGSGGYTPPPPPPDAPSE